MIWWMWFSVWESVSWRVCVCVCVCAHYATYMVLLPFTYIYLLLSRSIRCLLFAIYSFFEFIFVLSSHCLFIWVNRKNINLSSYIAEFVAFLFLSLISLLFPNFVLSISLSLAEVMKSLIRNIIISIRSKFSFYLFSFAPLCYFMGAEFSSFTRKWNKLRFSVFG